MSKFTCEDCVISGTDACRFGINRQVDYYSEGYCEDLLVEQNHAFSLGFKEGIRKTLELVKSHSEDDKLMNEWYVEWISRMLEGL